jgi:hypothetical protein
MNKHDIISIDITANIDKEGKMIINNYNHIKKTNDDEKDEYIIHEFYSQNEKENFFKGDSLW